MSKPRDGGLDPEDYGGLPDAREAARAQELLDAAIGALDDGDGGTR